MPVDSREANRLEETPFEGIDIETALSAPAQDIGLALRPRHPGLGAAHSSPALRAKGPKVTVIWEPHP